MVQGEVTLSDDTAAMLRYGTQIGGRHMGEDHAREFGLRNAVPGELLARLTPTHVVAEAEIAV